ncbi:MAG TPA: RDD family protein, partial [Nitrobacter sp.]|nr:RDD family protein [Nitrobacter sp.]
MAESGFNHTHDGNSTEFRPHAFDPWMQPELFRGVLTRRFFAFLIDLVVLSIPVIFGVIFIAMFG